MPDCRTLPTPSRNGGSSPLPALLLAIVLALPAMAHATPGSAAEPVMRLLGERGLIDSTAAASAEAGLVERIRNRAADMVVTAMNFLGVPYRRGGQSYDEGFDCSGFTRHIFGHSLGLMLPRRVDEQATAPGLLAVKRNDLEPGDLVFFNTLRRTFSHVGIYVGEGKFIHAPRTGGAVRVEDMRFAYWAKRYTGARRAPPATQPLELEGVAKDAAQAE